MKIPFFEEIEQAKSILLIGCGGGHDIASGLPLYLYLRGLGKDVVLASLSFTDLDLIESEEVCPHTYRVTAQSKDLEYFPEKTAINWLKEKGEAATMYAFDIEMGVQPLRHAYRYLIEQHNIDTLILIDGGTDSLMFGDEFGTGTMVEDSCSIIAGAGVDLPRSYLIATGFGVERAYGQNHYSCLENIAKLTREGAYKGALSLTSEMTAGRDYLEMQQYFYAQNQSHQSLIVSSIASSIKGDFGVQATHRPADASDEPFISPLMAFYWFFALEGIASRIVYASKIENSETMNEVAQAYRLSRAMNSRRANQEIPL